MGRVRLKGVVREANRLRQALAVPMSPTMRDALDRRRRDSLRQIESILSRHNASPNQLPAPSRQAYEFLKQADLSRVDLTDSTDPDASPSLVVESVSYRGLRSFLDGLLDDVARTLAEGRFNVSATLHVIRQTAERLDHSMHRDGLTIEHLKPASRGLVGWFRYFADEDHLGRYADAVRVAQSVFDQLPAAQTRWRRPLWVHFRPSGHFYRWRAFDGFTRIILDTPMISFDADVLRHVGDMMIGRKSSRRAVHAAMLAEDYQLTSVEMESVAGVVERSRGSAYDLADVFDRVNRRYFNGELGRPKLAWTRRLTCRTFGHYCFVTDQLCVSSTLDHPEVPAFVVDHVMHHELLHKQLGSKWRGARQHVHTPAFRMKERCFDRYKEADRFLHKLGGAYG